MKVTNLSRSGSELSIGSPDRDAYVKFSRMSLIERLDLEHRYTAEVQWDRRQFIFAAGITEH